MNINYSILGAGAMGTAFGARLTLAGFNVELLNRSPAQSQAIAKHGLLATLNGQQHTLKIAATTVEKANPADVVIIFTKSFQIKPALEQLPASLQNAQIITLQNGLGNGAQVAAEVGIERTIEGVTMMPAQLLKPGEVVSSDAAETWLYHAAGKPNALTDQVGADFNLAGITTTVTPAVHNFIWQKASFNVAMNALCGLIGASPGMLDHFPDGKAFAHDIATETLVIAKASGATVDEEKVHSLIEYACANHLRHKPSMLQDLENQRSTEIDALNGYIVDLADTLGLDAPLNRMLTRLVRLKQVAPTFWKS